MAKAKAKEQAPKVEVPIDRTVKSSKTNADMNATSLSINYSDMKSLANVMVPNDHVGMVKYIHDSYKLKPQGLVMNELKWKYLIRQSLRGRNIMMTGPAGSGKTLAAFILPRVLGRMNEIFNLGQTQDPQSYLIGNTHFRDAGTIFDESLFVKMIQIPNSVIILDELSRAHPDAWNILMPVLDMNQRYLRLDAKPGSPTIKVADGVTFVSTANIGAEYTATRAMDRALVERFVICEMDILNQEQEFGLLQYMYPGVDEALLQAQAAIAWMSRVEIKTDAPKINSIISTRQSVEMAGMMFDGFTLQEAAEEVIYPFYSTDGGNDSERTFVKALVQKQIKTDKQSDAEVKVNGDLFDANDIANAAP